MHAPYKIWHHEHMFPDAANGGTETEDRVTYTLRFRHLGDPGRAVVVGRTKRLPEGLSPPTY